MSKIHLNQVIFLYNYIIKIFYQPKRKLGIKKLNPNPKALIDCSQTIDGVFENFEDYNPTKKRKVLIEFNDMIPDKVFIRLSLIVTKLISTGRKLNISLLFILQSYFKVPKTIRLNSRHYFIMPTNKKYSNK